MSEKRRIGFAAGYVLIVESLLAALAALFVAHQLEASFANVPGGLLGALATPGAPLLVEGLLPFFFERAPRVMAALLALFAVHALVAPLVQLAWLAGLAPEGSPGPLRTAITAYFAAIRLRVLLLVPTGFVLVVMAILVGYASLLLRAADERASDLARVSAVLLGGWLFTPLRVLADLGHASLVRAALAREPLSARQAVHEALWAFSPGAYLRWALSSLLGLAALGVGTWVGASLTDALALLVTQLAAYFRYASRGAWLATALASVSDRRFGNRTRNSAPPPASPAFSAEMVPP